MYPFVSVRSDKKRRTGVPGWNEKGHLGEELRAARFTQPPKSGYFAAGETRRPGNEKGKGWSGAGIGRKRLTHLVHGGLGPLLAFRLHLEECADGDAGGQGKK